MSAILFHIRTPFELFYFIFSIKFHYEFTHNSTISNSRALCAYWFWGKIHPVHLLKICFSRRSIYPCPAHTACNLIGVVLLISARFVQSFNSPTLCLESCVNAEYCNLIFFTVEIIRRHMESKYDDFWRIQLTEWKFEQNQGHRPQPRVTKGTQHRIITVSTYTHSQKYGHTCYSLLHKHPWQS